MPDTNIHRIPQAGDIIRCKNEKDPNNLGKDCMKMEFWSLCLCEKLKLKHLH